MNGVIYDRNTLKSTICNLRDREGKSFQEISDILRNDYGIVKSRQAVYGMYMRSRDNEEYTQSDAFAKISDILHMYAIGYNASLIYENLSSLNISDLSYTKVLKVTKNGDRDLKMIENTIILGIADLLKNENVTYDAITAYLTYKGFKPRGDTTIKFIAAATDYIIKEHAIEQAVKAYEITKSPDVIKLIVNGIKDCVQYKEVIKNIKERRQLT